MGSSLHRLQGFPVKLLLAVTLISLGLGQCHPFSRFPMYSSFPPSADIYYLTDPNGHHLPTLDAVGIFAPELKQRVEHQYEAYGVEWGRENYLRQAGQEVLFHLAEEREQRLSERSIQGLSLRRVRLHYDGHRLIKDEQEVATWP